MDQRLLALLRDKTLSIEKFREVADQIAVQLAEECSSFIRAPLTLVPVLRSGVVLLHSFLLRYPMAKVGFLGIRRNEETAIPSLYYKKLPALVEDALYVILDPMLATGGSASMAISELKKHGILEKDIVLVSIIGAPEGIARVAKNHPKVYVHVMQIDQGLDSHNYIVPGLGDFGDRYYGTTTTNIS